MNKRVVVTGVGVVSPIGNTRNEFYKGLREGRNGIGHISGFETSECKGDLAGKVNVNPTDYFPGSEVRKMDRFIMLGMIAS